MKYSWLMNSVIYLIHGGIRDINTILPAHENASSVSSLIIEGPLLQVRHYHLSLLTDDCIVYWELLGICRRRDRDTTYPPGPSLSKIVVPNVNGKFTCREVFLLSTRNLLAVELNLFIYIWRWTCLSHGHALTCVVPAHTLPPQLNPWFSFGFV
jgi:hypothetical protein